MCECGVSKLGKARVCNILQDETLLKLIVYSICADPMGMHRHNYSVQTVYQ